MLQQAFPDKPVYTPTQVLSVSLAATECTTEKDVTKQVLQELNGHYQEHYSHYFLDSVVVNCKDAQIEKRKTPQEKRAKQKQIVKRYTHEVNKKFAENAGITFLAEDESF